jgi:hypothetical protein
VAVFSDTGSAQGLESRLHDVSLIRHRPVHDGIRPGTGENVVRGGMRTKTGAYPALVAHVAAWVSELQGCVQAYLDKKQHRAEQRSSNSLPGEPGEARHRVDPIRPDADSDRYGTTRERADGFRWTPPFSI